MKALLFISMLIISFPIQLFAKDPVKWGKVSLDELKMTVYQNEPDAPAVILSDYGDVTVGPRTEYTRHVRIKILRNAGLKYANIEIPFRYDGRYEFIQDLDVLTFNLDDKETIIKTKLPQHKIAEEQIDSKNRKKVFTFPDVKPGSVIEYRYTIVSLDLVKLQTWYFQSTIPTVLSSYELSIPNRFDYLVTYQKGRPLDMEEQQMFAQKIQWLYNTKIKKVHRELAPSKYLLWDSPKGTAKVYAVYGQTTRFKMKNIPSFKPEKGMETFSDYYPCVKAHLYLATGYYPFYYRTIMVAAKKDYDSYSLRDMKYGMNFTGYIIYWLPTWEEANKSWLKNEYLGMRMTKAFNYKPVLDSILKPDDLEINNIQRIYKYVRENIAWNGEFTLLAMNDLNKVFEKKSGTSSEINLLLIGLLRRAGFTVDPVLVRTRNLGRIENMYPVKDQFNHVVAQVIVNGKVIYLDGATTQKKEDKLPWYINHTTGWLLKSEGSMWVDVTDDKQVAQDVKEL
jgi:hypothetical protein